MRIAFLCVVLTLGCIQSVTMEAAGIPPDNPRDILLNNLKLEVARFIKAGKFSQQNQKQISVALSTFEKVPPLKTAEEIRKDESRFESSEWRRIKKELVKIVQDYLKKRSGEELPSTQVTPDQAYDLFRLLILESIFMEEGVKSEALETLMDRVFERILHTTRA